MKLREHYRISRRKRRKSYIITVIFIILVITRCYTLARYKGASDIDTMINVAKWNILINGEPLEEDTTELDTQIKIIPDDTTKTYLEPGDTGYFDIEINPEETEVSIEYTIGMDLSNLPIGTTITSCDLTVNSETVNLFTGNNLTIEDSIRLKNRQALESTDTHKYRVHCKIDDNAVFNHREEYYMGITIEGKQII